MGAKFNQSKLPEMCPILGVVTELYNLLSHLKLPQGMAADAFDGFIE